MSILYLWKVPSVYVLVCKKIIEPTLCSPGVPLKKGYSPLNPNLTENLTYV